ncbi:MAG: hypothetical protein M3464_06915 [Chloroflexota bacterium]|nr:hypothetical protein [Chloroflexota bacterium]
MSAARLPRVVGPIVQPRLGEKGLGRPMAKQLRLVRSESKPNRLHVYDDVQLIGQIDEHEHYVGFSYERGYAKTTAEAVAALAAIGQVLDSTHVNIGFPDWTLPKSPGTIDQ